jgi:hypothetical protein
MLFRSIFPMLQTSEGIICKIARKNEQRRYHHKHLCTNPKGSSMRIGDSLILCLRKTVAIDLAERGNARHTKIVT